MRKGRCVSYIYRYRDDRRCENAGFIKIQCVSNGSENQARIQIGLKLYKKNECCCKIYLLHGNAGRYFTDINFCAKERDTIMKRMFVSWDNPLDNGVPLDEYSGLFFLCDDGEQLMGIWDNKNISPKNIIISKNEKIQEVKEIPTIELKNAYQDACDRMLDTYPKLAMFADSQITECVKINPQDIGKLHMSNWKLGTNSFLSHGFYQYRYIMLGKIKIDDEKEKVVIGVPGVFTNKERYIANMFGFGQFIPVKREKLITGKFGYWVSEVSRM